MQGSVLGEVGWPTDRDLVSLARRGAQPCVSLYLPLRRSRDEQVANARRFGRAVAEASEGLRREGLSPVAVERWCARLAEVERELRDGRPLQGVGVFLDEGGLDRYRLPAPPAERIVVADGFALRELARQVDLWRSEPRVLQSAKPLTPQLDRILLAASRGGIDKLWMRDGARISGRLDRDSGRILAAFRRDDDVLDALARRVLQSGGGVHVVPAHVMPMPVCAVAALR